MNWKPEDLLDPEVMADETKLHALYKWMRENNPRPIISCADGQFRPFRAITRYADVLEIEKHPELFTNEPQAILVPKRIEDDLFARTGGKYRLMDTLIHMDPPQHTVYRKLTQSWFNPGEVKKLTPKIHEIAKEHIDRIATAGACDFTCDVTTWYPLHIIMLILGIPREHEQFIMKVTQKLMSPEEPGTPEGQEQNDRIELVLSFLEFCMKLVGGFRANPDDSLGSVLANAKIDGEEVPVPMILSYYVIILVAGHDTTKFASSGGLLALLQHPREMAKLRANPALFPNAIEEMIRWAAPVRHFMRNVQQSTVIGDTQLEKGDRLMLLYASASRDTAMIKDADQFLVDREPNRHLSFGHGIHVCLGQHLARLEMRILFEEFLGRFGTVELAGKPEGLISQFVAGIKNLPISYRR